MYRKVPDNLLAFKDFYLPFSGKLRSNNRWALLAKMVPWDTIEPLYAEQAGQEAVAASTSEDNDSDGNTPSGALLNQPYTGQQGHSSR